MKTSKNQHEENIWCCYSSPIAIISENSYNIIAMQQQEVEIK